MNQLRTAIFGMGLMGGSLALALKEAVGSLSAVDPDPETRRLVREANLVDEISEDPVPILTGADLIILAAPVGQILEIIPRLPDWHAGQAVVLDLGSTKGAVCRELTKLPDRFDPLGGHPICGKAAGGFEHAESDLYQGAPFVFSALPQTSSRARKVAEQLAAAIGAKPLWMEADLHDTFVGATSHLPYLLSVVQVLATPESAGGLTGPGFQSATRLANTPPEMILDVLLTNRDPVLDHLERAREILEGLEKQLRSPESSGLRSLLERAAARKEQLDREAA